MNVPVATPSILESADVDPGRAGDILGSALSGADDGELFIERAESESFLFDDGRLKSAAYDANEGFGLRVVAGETAGYAHAQRNLGRCDPPGRRLRGLGEARLLRRGGRRAPPHQR